MYASETDIPSPQMVINHLRRWSLNGVLPEWCFRTVMSREHLSYDLPTIFFLQPTRRKKAARVKMFAGTIHSVRYEAAHTEFWRQAAFAIRPMPQRYRVARSGEAIWRDCDRSMCLREARKSVESHNQHHLEARNVDMLHSRKSSPTEVVTRSGCPSVGEPDCTSRQPVPDIL